MKKNNPEDDSLLIHRAQKGDIGAFNFLMTKYYPITVVEMTVLEA